MKTVTEFFGINLKNISKTVQELSAAGKTQEELQTALIETFKIKEERVKLLLDALEVVKTRLEGLKRVVVFTAAENDKIPSGVEKKDDHYYLAEFFPAAPGAEKKRGRHDQRDEKRGGRKGKRGGRDARGGGRGEARTEGRSEGRGEGKPEGQRRRRAPKPQPQFSGPKPPPVVVPKLKNENAPTALPAQSPGKSEDGSASGPTHSSS